jgi:D-alanyl-D-alanine carboxypeptidase
MRTIFVAALLSLMTVRVQAQLPNTPAGHRLAGWLAAFNSGQVDVMRRYLEESTSADARDRLLEASPGLMDFRARTGGFDFRKSDTSTATELSAFVQERARDRFARIVVKVAPDAPHRIVAMSIAPSQRPAEFAIARLTEPAFVSAVRDQLSREAAAGRFAGAVMISRDGRAVLSNAYGDADRASHSANSTDTRFRIGSMNKMFTAVAVLQLVQAGTIRLDAPLATYLPEYPNRDAASKVTIHHLLTHTGGTGDFFGPDFDAHRLELRTISDYVARFGTRPLEFEPGSRWSYSNFGYILLGAVIERASGMSYYDYVSSHVFAPAGMTSSGSAPEDSVGVLRAVGYTSDRASGKLETNAASLPYRGSPAGGGYSTVGDLVRFANALRENRLLDSTHTALLITGKVASPGGKYAYGFEDRTVGGDRIVGHGGAAPGMNGELAIDVSTGYVVAVLANVDPPAAQIVSEYIVERLPRP